MSKVKVTPELQATIDDYKAILGNVIDSMIDSSSYIRKQLKLSLKDIVEVYSNNNIDPKKLSIDKDSKLYRDVSAIIALLRDKLQLYMQSVLANDIYTYLYQVHLVK